MSDLVLVSMITSIASTVIAFIGGYASICARKASKKTYLIVNGRWEKILAEEKEAAYQAGRAAQVAEDQALFAAAKSARRRRIAGPNPD